MLSSPTTDVALFSRFILIKSAYPNTLNNPFSNGIAVSYPADDSQFENGIIFGKELSAVWFVPYDYEGTFEIPNSVTQIGQSAFQGCKDLTAIEIPNSVTSIGAKAFYGCSGITDINVEWESPITISINEVFESETLENILLNIPENTWVSYVIEYSWNQFKNIRCGELTVTDYTDGTYFYRYLPTSGKAVLVYNSSNTNLTSISIPQRISAEGSFYSIIALGANAFKDNTNAKGDLVIPNGCEFIGTYVFYGCKNLSSVTIPPSLKESGTDAFGNCSGLSRVDISDLSAYCKIIYKGNSTANPLNLAKHLYLDGEEITDLVIPDDVTHINFAAFYFASSIKSVTIPTSVISISEHAFGRSGLKMVLIPSSVVSYSGLAFSNCNDLETITFAQSEEPLQVKGGNLLQQISPITLNLERNLTLAEGSTSGTTSLTKVNFGGNITLINDGLFNGNSKLKEIVIPSSVNYIGESAFENCGLTSIAIGSGIEEIGDKAFAGNTPSTIAVTAFESPMASNTTFSNINGKLMVTPGSEDIYYNNPNCWYQFNYPTPLVVATELKVESTVDNNGNVKLVGTVEPAEASLPYVIWKSTDINSAVIDPEGSVHFINGTSTGSLVGSTLYADGPVVTVTVTKEGNITSVEGGNVGIGSIDAEFDGIYRVFSIQGINVMNTENPEDLNNLAKGVYIINGKKVIIGK